MMTPDVRGGRRMRGRRNPQVTMLAFVDLEERVPVQHPLRRIKRLADAALEVLSPELDALYQAGGPPRRSGEPDRELPWRAPLERNPPEHDRPRGAPAEEGKRQGSQTGVPGPRVDGEPQRAAGGLPVERSDRAGGARGGAPAAG